MVSGIETEQGTRGGASGTWIWPFAAVAGFAAWYFWPWQLALDEALWIAALFVIPPLIVWCVIAGLLRIAFAGLDHDALRSLRGVLYGARRSRWPAVVRLYAALLGALLGPARPWGMFPFLALAIVLPLAMLIVGLGLFDLRFVSPALIEAGLGNLLSSNTWTYRHLFSAALYPVLLPATLLFCLVFGIGAVRAFAFGVGTLAMASRRVPVTALLRLILIVCLIVNAAIVVWRAETTPLAHEETNPGPSPSTILQRHVAQADALLFRNGRQDRLYRLPHGDVRVFVAGDHVAYARHREAFDDSFARFGDLTQRRFIVGQGPSATSQLAIVLTQTDRFNGWAWRRGRGLRVGLKAPAACRTDFAQHRIYIGTNLSDARFRRCIAHELGHFVGLTGHACYTPSVMCALGEENLTKGDERVIRALYNPTLAHGMSRESARPLIENLLSDALHEDRSAY